MTVLFSFPVLESPEEVLAMLNSECREDEASKLLKGGGKRAFTVRRWSRGLPRAKRRYLPME